MLSRYLLPLLPVVAWLTWRAVERWWLGESPSPARRQRAIVLAGVLALTVLVQNLIVFRTTVVPHVTSFTAGLQGSLVTWGWLCGSASWSGPWPAGA